LRLDRKNFIFHSPQPRINQKFPKCRVKMRGTVNQFFPLISTNNVTCCTPEK
jgi:hypothetical protein